MKVKVNLLLLLLFYCLTNICIHVPTAVIIHKIQFIQLLLKERKEPLKFLIKAESQKAVTRTRDPRNKKQETINIGTNLRGER